MMDDYDVPVYPPPPPSPADVVSDVIKQAKAKTAAKQAKEQSKQDKVRNNITGVLNGLSKLREASNRAFEYTIQEQTPGTLKVTTNLKGRFNVIFVNGNSKLFKNWVGVGKGLKKNYLADVDLALTMATKKALKQGLIRP
jgi:hypothetical protein